MKKFTVAISVVGYVYVEVEAETKEEATELADCEVSNMDFNCLEDIELKTKDVWED